MSKEKEIVKSSRFMLMEAADNAQIVAEINGEMLKAMVYQYKGKNRLSYAGAKFAAIQLGNIHVKESSVNYNKDLDQFEASALAYNENINLTLPGYAEQPRLMKVYDNKERTESHLELDEFARRKAASKAVRNALMAVMPADHIAAYMRAAIDGGKTRIIKNVEVEQVPVKEKPRAKVGPPPRKTQPKPAAEKPKPKNKPEKKAIQMSLGTVDVDTVDYNLKAVGFGEDVVIVLEQGDYVIVDPTRELTEEEIYKISGILEDIGAVFEEKGYYEQQWKIKKNA